MIDLPGGPNKTYGSLSTFPMIFFTVFCCSAFNFSSMVPFSLKNLEKKFTTSIQMTVIVVQKRYVLERMFVLLWHSICWGQFCRFAFVVTVVDQFREQFLLFDEIQCVVLQLVRQSIQYKADIVQLVFVGISNQFNGLLEYFQVDFLISYSLNLPINVFCLYIYAGFRFQYEKIQYVFFDSGSQFQQVTLKFFMSRPPVNMYDLIN